MELDGRTYLQAGTDTKTYYVTAPSADLRTNSSMGTQALFGQKFDVIEMREGFAHGALRSILPSSDRIDYIGYISLSALTDSKFTPTHRVGVLCAAVFEAADIKSPLIGSLPRNAVVEGIVEGGFLRLNHHGSMEESMRGYIDLRHLRDVPQTSDRCFTALAADMLGLPYIWGGTGWVGVDCSGLVQSALAATGVDAPRDADQQEAILGQPVDFTKRQAGDLLFWAGHVGIVVEGDKLLHANAHHMRVALEPAEQAVARIGAVRTVKRL